MRNKPKPVLAVRAFWADPLTGKEVKGHNSTTVYDTDERPILLRAARRIHSHMKVRKGTLPARTPRKYVLEVAHA